MEDHGLCPLRLEPERPASAIPKISESLDVVRHVEIRVRKISDIARSFSVVGGGGLYLAG